MPLSSGTILGHYEVRSLLGAGGMGEVYLAQDTALRRPVAIKLLPTDFTANKDWLHRFEREAYAASSLNHPNILTIHEIGVDDGRRFIATEFIDGESLRRHMGGASLQFSEILDIGFQVASALAAAHAAGIVHRDIKPENIMLRRDQLVKVLDFGLAKLVEEQTPTLDREAETKVLHNTQPGMVMGTVSYMSPEQARGKNVDARTDIWSLGVVLYEMVTGALPFVGETTSDVLGLILYKEPLPLTSLGARVPAEFDRIVAKALRKDKEERYQTIKDLASDLKSLKRRLEFEAELERSFPPEEAEARARASQSRNEDQPLMFDGSSVSARTNPLNNLSDGFSLLVGREREIEKIENLLRRDDVRLVTMTGIGGTGKTRLAKEIARRLLEDFSGGVFLIELAAINDPVLVISSIALPLDVKEAGGKSLIDTLKTYLREKQILLVVDNFEQVTPAAPLLAELLASSPHLKMLVTSRALLHLSAEYEVIVPPLSVPSAVAHTCADDLLKYEAVRLFVERAQMVKPNFMLTDENARSVAEICTRLEGLPLAIELAAARIKVLQPQAISARLENRLKLLTGGARDLPARQQTMRGAVEWSYDLLERDEKVLFRRLAVFAGGATIEAAESVCSGHGLTLQTESEIDTLDGIASLVDKSLLVQKERAEGESRFRMLEVVREYALESLQTSGEGDTLRRLHAGYFLALAEEAEPELVSERAAEWLDRLEEEYDNLRAALHWGAERDAETALRLAVAMRQFWHIHGHLTEGCKWLEAALNRSGDASDSARLKALNASGRMASLRGDYQSARKFYEESLAVSRAAGDKRQIALSSNDFGVMAYLEGDLAAARPFLEESLATGRELGDKEVITKSLTALGEMARTEGNYASARLLYEESLVLRRLTGNKDGVSNSLINLGAASCLEGDYQAALSCYAEALVIQKEMGHKTDISHSLDGFAALAIECGDVERAARLAGAAEHLRESIGYELETSDRLFCDAYLKKLRGALSAEALAVACEQGRKMKLDEAIEMALEAV